MKRIAILPYCFVLAQVLSAQDTNTLEVRPGVVHSTYNLPGPNVVHVISFPLGDPRYRVVSFRPERLTTVSEQVIRASGSGKKVVAAVNADFFSFQTHLPVGLQFVDGRLVHAGRGSIRSQFAMTASGKPLFDRQRFSALAQIGHFPWQKVDGFNTPVDSGEVVLFDGSAGGRVRIPKGIRFFRVRALSPVWGPGDTLILVSPVSIDVVDTLWYPEGNVLALGAGTENIRISSDDTIRVVYEVGTSARLSEAVGGGGRILYDGVPAGDSVNALEKIGRKFRTDRHPRTFVAIDRDSTKLFLCTVDGRQATSVGLNFAEMADFLLSIGGWNAVNLDGGGSTAMVIDGTVVNRPSDKNGERAVANTLMVIETDSAP